MLLAAHVGLQGFGNGDAPGLVLVVLQQRDQGSADREARAVEGVHQLGLAGFRAEAGLQTARLC